MDPQPDPDLADDDDALLPAQGSCASAVRELVASALGHDQLAGREITEAYAVEFRDRYRSLDAKYGRSGIMTGRELVIATVYALLAPKVRKIVSAKIKGNEKDEANRQVALRVQATERRGRGSRPTAEMLHARRSATSAGDDGAGDGAASDQLVYHNRKPRPDEGRGFLHLNRSG